LRDPQSFRCSTEVAGVRHGDRVPELSELHGDSIGQTCLYDTNRSVRYDWPMGASPIPNEGSPAGRPRERVVETAADLFFRKGIRATGVDSLIEHAGVAKSTFYRHFRSKDELIVAWLRSSRARWIDGVTAGLETDGTPPARALVEFWDRLGDWAEHEEYLGCPYLKTLAEIEEPSHVARLEVDAFVHEVDAFFTRIAAACGFHRPEEIGVRLRLLAMGALTAIVLERSREPMHRARDLTVHFLASWQGVTRSEMEALMAAPASEA
jgi:AcrR family transcriptional regulator